MITDCVLKESKIIGKELLTICAKNISSNLMPLDAGKYEFSEFYTNDKYYHQSSYSATKNILSSLKTHVIDKLTLQSINEEAKLKFKNDIHFVDVLWQNGAIGYMNSNDVPEFYAQHFDSDTLLAMNKEKYIFRACIAVKLDLK